LQALTALRDCEQEDELLEDELLEDELLEDELLEDELLEDELLEDELLEDELEELSYNTHLIGQLVSPPFGYRQLPINAEPSAELIEKSM
jgi:hypothetical protein